MIKFYSIYKYKLLINEKFSIDNILIIKKENHKIKKIFVRLYILIFMKLLMRILFIFVFIIIFQYL